MNATIKLGYEFDKYKESFGFSSAPAPRTISNPITDDSDAGLVTIAGTDTGKGVSQVIPTALTYPGSMVILDLKRGNSGSYSPRSSPDGTRSYFH